MLQVNEYPVRKLSDPTDNYETELKEFTDEMNYAKRQVAIHKWNLADYWYHMAEFFDYIGLPADAESHRHKAKFWIQGVPEKGVKIIDPDYPDECSYVNVGRRDVGIIKSIADCK